MFNFLALPAAALRCMVVALRSFLHLLACLGRVAAVFVPVALGLLAIAWRQPQETSVYTLGTVQKLDRTLTGSIR
jgi:hypothetical protein